MVLRKISPNDFELEGSYPPIVFTNKNNDKRFAGINKNLLDDAFNKNGINPNLNLADVVLPISLRWRTSLKLGLPLTAFKVWRRNKMFKVPSLIDVRFNNITQFNNGPFVKLSGVLTNNSGNDLTVNLFPKNSNFQNYASKNIIIQVAANSSTSFIIEQPNIYGLEYNYPNVINISSLKGILSDDYINDVNWELIQVVGLPFEKGYVKNELYNYEEQGFVNSLQKPVDAAITRLFLHKLFYIESPQIAPDGTAIPPWKTPDGTELVKSYYETAPINNGVTGVLNDINEMFEKVYNIAPAFYEGQQENYTKTIEGFGMYDEANSSPKKNGTYQHPVCAATLLSTSSDCWNALGLGFGTTDFLPNSNEIRANYIPVGLGSFDYMVTAQFRQPINSIFYENFSLKVKYADINIIEYAALCYNDIISPGAPPALLAEVLSENRPLKMDDFYYEQLRISWSHQLIQQKHPLVFSIAFNNAITNNINFLNQPRPFLKNYPQPLLPAARIDKGVEDVAGRDGLLFDKFIYGKVPAPFIGNVTHSFYVAAQDVFGTWSDWSVCTQNLISKPPQKPNIISAKFTNILQIANTDFNEANLEIIFNWNWEDRSPFEIRFTGHFFTPPVPYADPSAWAMPGIAMGNGIVKRYAVRFAINGTPMLYEIKPFNIYEPIANADGEVIVETSFTEGSSNGSAQSSIDDTRTYKLIFYKIQLDFIPVSKLYYAIEAIGFELVNTSLASDTTIPYVITCVDPNPRPAPVFFTDIKWASLPDVSNVSRYHLKFPAVPGAVGYAIYCATETSLRAKFTDLQTYPDQGTIFQRRNVLDGATAGDKNRAIDAFIRLNRELLKDPVNGIELEINGDVGGLYIYAVSSFTEQNVESKFSNWIYVAIPQRITPGVPGITGYVNNKLPVPKLIVRVNIGLGNNTELVQLYKTNKANLAADLNIMGLPYAIGPNDGKWKKYKTSSPVDELIAIASSDKYDYLLYEEDIIPTWQTIYLRSAALGINSPGDGLFPGKSASSNLLELIPPIPETLSQITNAVILKSGVAALQVSFKSNAFAGRSNYGSHIITIYQQSNDGIFEELIQSEIPQISKINAGDSETANVLYRLMTDNNGFILYHYNIPVSAVITLQIKVTDPVGRNTLQMLNYQDIPLPLPGQIQIKDIVITKQMKGFFIEFKTTVNKIPPVMGAQGTQLLININLKNNIAISIIKTFFHLIPDKLLTPGSGIFGGTGIDAFGFYSYTVFIRNGNVLPDISNAKTLDITIKGLKDLVVTSTTDL